MHESKQYSIHGERGTSLSGLIFLLAIVGVIAVFAMKVFPSFVEYRSIQNAVTAAKALNGSVREMQESFDKNVQVSNITALSGRDLVISKESGQPEISFKYEKRIPLVANVSLLIDYAGTTDKSGVVAERAVTAAK
jgi:type II secretory pathway pseudopilin PulG